MSPPRPEVLSPAGSPEALRAAIGAGADAVYFGLTDYNARVRARNFELGELPDVLQDLRRWGVRSYLAFNTLIFLDEERAARDALAAIAQAGPDGIIVQDLGVASMLREIAPWIPVHASTQMTVASAEAVRFVEGLGISRVILARELTLPEIARIRRATAMELEVFVHGALCVSYSGQCLSSEAWGGRSANRGQCAQACRLPYELRVDGRTKDLGDRAYLLSPRDLEGYRHLPELIALGISAFKIEGRMKSPEYVAAATALYRKAVDRAWEAQGRPSGQTQATVPAGAPVEEPHLDPSLGRLVQESRQIFSRGGSAGFLGGVDHQVLVDGTTRSHRGVPAGRVAGVERDGRGRPSGILMTLSEGAESALDLKAGDGLLLAVSALEEDEVGGRIFSIVPAGRPRSLRIRFARESMPDLDRVRPGTPVYRTADPALMERLRLAVLRPEALRRVPLTMRVRGKVGEPLVLEVADAEGRRVRVSSRVLLSRAEQRSLDRERIITQLGRLGETRYTLLELETDIEDGLFVPVSELNHLRRGAIDEVERVRGALPDARPPVPPGEAETLPDRRRRAPERLPAEMPSPVLWAVQRAGPGTAEEAATPAMVASPAPGEGSPGTSASVSPPASGDGFQDRFLILCRDMEQVRGALDAGAARIVLDFLDLVGLKEASHELGGLGIRRTLAMPRVQKPGEERIASFFVGLAPEEILVRNLGGLETLRDLAAARGRRAQMSRVEASPGLPLLVGDVSLNAVNPRSFRLLLDCGLARLAPGLDLNGEQLVRLVEEVDPDRVEIPIHHHLPIFHTEHCVFAACLSDGADYRSCGRPCDRHRIELRDRTGQSHPVVADVGCRNTVFGARPQSGLPHLAALRLAGVGAYRCELISQDRRGTARVVSIYRSVWEERRSWKDALERLGAEGRYGVSTGSPEPSREMRKRAGARAKRKEPPEADRWRPTPVPAPPVPPPRARGSGRARDRG